MADNILAAFGYAPIGGLQIFGIIGGFLSKDSFIKFNALQALAYWIVMVILAIPFILVMGQLGIISAFGGGDIYRFIGIAILLIYFFGFLFLLPLYFAVQAYKGKTFYLPIVGKKIAGMVGYTGSQSQ